MDRFVDYIILIATIAGTACTANTYDTQVFVNSNSAIISELAAKSNNEDDGCEITLTDEEIDLIALVTMAEAEGESEYGQRLVIDTVLNRMDSEHFPDTVYDVIYQPYQFTCMWNSRAERCESTEEMRGLVKEELRSRADSSVIFFRASHYSEYGKPLFKEGSHYFSSYE